MHIAPLESHPLAHLVQGRYNLSIFYNLYFIKFFFNLNFGIYY